MRMIRVHSKFHGDVTILTAEEYSQRVEAERGERVDAALVEALPTLEAQYAVARERINAAPAVSVESILVQAFRFDAINRARTVVAAGGLS